MSCKEITCPKCGRTYCSCDMCPCEYADLVIDGYYGNGNERKEKLGVYYGEIQNIVNEKLGISKRHPE